MSVRNVVDLIVELISRSQFSHLISGPAQDVVDVLYLPDFAEGDKDIDIFLREIAAAMPHDQISVANICDSVTNLNLKLLCLRAGLLVVDGENGWIHYRICISLFSLKELGVKRLDFPLLTHSLLILNRIGHTAPAAYFTAGLSASLLKDISSLDTAQFALTAIDSGNSDALNSLKYLYSRGQNDKTYISDLSVVEKYRAQIHDAVFEKIVLNEVSFLREGSSAYFAPPNNGADHFIFNVNGLERIRPSISGYVVNNGSISVRAGGSSGSEFYVFTEDGKLIENLSYGLRPFRSDNKVRKSGSAALVSDRWTIKSNICHFLLDHLTRVKLYESSYGRVDRFIFLQNDQYIRDSLALVGIDDRAVMLTEQETEISADKILIVSNLARDWSHPAHFGDPSLLEIFADWPAKVRAMRSKAPIGTARRRIFISRDDAPSRRILNQQEVDSILEKFGFEKQVLSQYSIFDQIELFSEASVVVGVHGAGLTNILFGNSDMKVIEILPSLVATDAYWQLARSRGQSYNAVIGIDPEFGVPDYKNWSHKPLLNDRDLFVNVKELEAAIESALRT